MVAVSGGSDSTGVLLAFHELLQEPEFASFQLLAVTVDHDLRAESAGEAQQVAQLCRALNIVHQIKHWHGQKPKSGISDASRQARYQLLSDAARALSADVILLGHNAGDQRETIAMRSARSLDTDAYGLSGMAEATLIDRHIWACRPFLKAERDTIRDYLKARGQAWIDDPSNDNPAYERVRLRRAGAEQFSSLDSSAAAQRTAASQQAAGFVDRFVTRHDHGLISVQRGALLEHPDAGQYALSYLAAIVGGQAYPMAKEQLIRLTTLASQTGNARINAHRVLFDLRKDRLYLCRELRNLPQPMVNGDCPQMWDQRLWVLPAGAEDVRVKIEHVSDAPQSLLNMAQKTQPTFDISGDTSPNSYRIEAYLRPFDQFLPLFDHALAQALARCFAVPAYPAPPFADLQR